MCTSRIVPWSALLAATLLGGTAARSGAVEPVTGWVQSPGARLVVVLLDGLVADCVLGTTVDGDPVMPRTAAWAGTAQIHTDVLVPTTQAQLARAQLDRLLQAFSPDAVRWATARTDGPASAVREFARTSGRGVLVLDLDWLTEPLHPAASTLTLMDPAPWTALGATLRIEDQVERRVQVADRLAPFQGRGAGRGQGARRRDLEWVAQAAHRDVDAALAELLEAASGLGPQTAVLLTATSSLAMGARSVQGTHRGAELDAARVPFLLRLDGLVPTEVVAPQQWMQLDAEWLLGGATDERWTWAWPASAEDVVHPVGQMRWTTADFTLLDTTLPQRSPRLFDLQLDPGEWLDQGIAHPVLADSLRQELRARLYGSTPTLVLTAGATDLVLQIRSTGRLEGPDGINPDDLHLRAGEEVRIRMADGARDLSFGRRMEWVVGDEVRSFDTLVVHSPDWRALWGAGPPTGGPGLRIE